MMQLLQPTLVELLCLCNEAREDEREQYYSLTGKEWQPEVVAAEHFFKDGVKYILLGEENKPIVAGGFDLIIPGVWQSWMVGTTANWDTHWRAITKYSRKVMAMMLDDECINARRLQTLVLASREKTCEWYRRGLKMKREASFADFGVNGETMDVYVRLKE